ncbi:hypothetical protein M9Y10_003429 [Tritrichomonas musculus]|uniref:Protein kinase domain-containing protein n=1 Tax=Tritrichomonas musculus TaxID=1915356 RepID=A0ABR2JR93_9EUKA
MLMIFPYEFLSILHFILDENPSLYVCFISNTRGIVDQVIQFENEEIEIDANFQNEINALNKELRLFKPTKTIKQIWPFIAPCISAYLIKKSYFNNAQKRVLYYSIIQELRYKIKTLNEDQYIELRTIGIGSSFTVILAYMIEYEQLIAIKKPNGMNDEHEKLINREIKNYLQIKHPLTPYFFGYFNDNGNNNKCIAFEYINGKILSLVNNIELDFDDKITIIYQLLLILRYLHENNFVFRDLKPNNVIIDEDKTIILIDFDRMIDINQQKDDFDRTQDLSSLFIAPEIIKTGNYSFKSDIYSLGKIIYFIMKEEEEFIQIEEIYKRCTNKIEEKRPSISELIYLFVQTFKNNIKYERISNISKQLNCLGYLSILRQDEERAIYYIELSANLGDALALFYLGSIYYNSKKVKYDKNKAVHYIELAANQGCKEAQYLLGVIFRNDSNLRNINKSFHYYLLAANQGDMKAQYNLAIFYDEGIFIQHDIMKAIYYYTLAADQGLKEAQHNLAMIYFHSENPIRNLKKSFHYFMLAASQGDEIAQNYIGNFYYEGKIVMKDIDKAIYYYSLSAEKKFVPSQYQLGCIYITRDINKAIYLLTLAANQNSPKAQSTLGNIYCEGKYVKYDIDKAIYYYTLAANQNSFDAQYNLGLIHHESKYGRQDIKKAIYYFSLAANQNFSEALFRLGLIYDSGFNVPRDINLAIHYYTLAANQNHSYAQYNLGVIYNQGKYVKKDIKKAIYYYSLASNNIAQYNLGSIFLEKRDLKKAIYYFELAASSKLPKAQFNLGLIYYSGSYVPRDLTKAIYYFQLSSNQGNAYAQLFLGLIYLKGEGIEKNIKKGLYLLQLSAKNEGREASFVLGCIYNEGKIIKKDINQAVRFYKEASSFNNQYAKNNLGIIFRDNEFKKDIGLAIEYFKEAIKQQDDVLAKFNLAHIYIYEEAVKKDFDEILELLISSNEFYCSKILLCIFLVKQFGFDLSTIKDVVDKKSSKLSTDIYQTIYKYKLYNSLELNSLNHKFENLRIVYDYLFNICIYDRSYFIKYEIKQKACDINSLFYEGLDL